MTKKLDTYRPDQNARKDEEIIIEKKLHHKSLAGRPRLALGNAIFFYKDERLKKKSIVQEWQRTGRK